MKKDIKMAYDALKKLKKEKTEVKCFGYHPDGATFNHDIGVVRDVWKVADTFGFSFKPHSSVGGYTWPGIDSAATIDFGRYDLYYENAFREKGCVILEVAT